MAAGGVVEEEGDVVAPGGKYEEYEAARTWQRKAARTRVCRQGQGHGRRARIVTGVPKRE